METKTTAILLRGGPGDGEIHQEIAVGCTVFSRLASKPEARYIDSGSVDRQGRRIFDYSPPRAGGV